MCSVVLKRGMDLVGAAFGLVLFAPVLMRYRNGIFAFPGTQPLIVAFTN